MTELLLCAIDGDSSLPYIEAAFAPNIASLATPFFITDTVIAAGYGDVSSIINWHCYGKRANKDYTYVRERIKEFYAATTWVSLTTEEQQICCQYFVAIRSYQK
jgi:hypothetical protein